MRVKGFVWILPDYMDPEHIKTLRVQSKRYITKVMFLCAVARPVFDGVSGECLFDGKVGCWRVAEAKKYKTKYHSKKTGGHHHERGDIHMVDRSLDSQLYIKMCKNLLLPAIRQFYSPCSSS